MWIYVDVSEVGMCEMEHRDGSVQTYRLQRPKTSDRRMKGNFPLLFYEQQASIRDTDRIQERYHEISI